MEHAPLDLMGVVQMLQALAGTKMVPVVRVPWNDAVTVKRVLDAGATTVMFPFVQNADEARRAVAATRYPPEGVRGMAGMSRASSFGTTPNYFRTANQRASASSCRSKRRRRSAADSRRSRRSTASMRCSSARPTCRPSMGHVGQFTHPAVLGLMSQAVQRCKAIGKPVGTLGSAPERDRAVPRRRFRLHGGRSDLGLDDARRAGGRRARCARPTPNTCTRSPADTQTSRY